MTHKILRRQNISIFCGAFLLFGSAPFASAQSPTCAQIFATLTGVVSPSVPALAAKFPVEQVSYGLESEYEVKGENHPILANYRSSFVSEKTWLAYDDANRIRRFQGAVSKYGKVWTAISHKLGLARLIKLSTAPNELPQELSIEAHGTVEVSGIVDSDISAVEKVYFHDLAPNFGKGAIQGHVVFPKAWKTQGAGYALFEGDRATLGALEAGYAAYVKDTNRTPAAFLIHYALGPHSTGSKKFLIEADEKLLRGESIGDGSYFRMVNGPAWRDDVYPKGKVGFEFRQYSFRPQAMFKEMRFLTALVTSGEIARFNFYVGADALSTDLFARVADAGAKFTRIEWSAFFARVGKHLREQSKFPVTGGSVFDVRFQTPLRNWEENPIFQNISAEEKAALDVRLTQARNEYVTAVEALMASTLSMPAIVIELRILNAKWAHDLKLSRYYDDFRAQIK